MHSVMYSTSSQTCTDWISVISNWWLNWYWYDWWSYTMTVSLVSSNWITNVLPDGDIMRKVELIWFPKGAKRGKVYMSYLVPCTTYSRKLLHRSTFEFWNYEWLYCPGKWFSCERRPLRGTGMHRRISWRKT